MVELTVIKGVEIPGGTKVTACALMPKILCCVEDGKFKMYVGRNNVRTFKHIENANKKFNKLNRKERLKAKRILKAVGNPVLSQRNIIAIKETEQPDIIGFDNAV